MHINLRLCYCRLRPDRELSRHTKGLSSTLCRDRRVAICHVIYTHAPYATRFEWTMWS